ncbi:hypothetical protein BU26DRAFT_148161 [Trematosphaeria pertusa]|uniref:Trichothecene 3-O-acetyltransferas-like protein n=1 Tax=Trematosphaeria pertusa TaxID=390896 RepID=A0A6A6IX16_9PLEO|nr:uncharacterized protein BU26DRAFT_148161 [Trematosphaeria pertusa]KAF2254934.1 hypothetical protein BU26DRAFT_148161 [Trematosphaeria pertusa]
MTNKKVIKVHPKDHTNDPAIERFELSDYDHCLPKIYTLIALVYKLGEGTASPETIIGNLQQGLEVTLSQYRSLSGVLRTSPESGKVWIQKRRESIVDLIANWMEDAFPSYEELEKADFPCHAIDGDALLPTALTQKQPLTPLGEEKEDDSVVFCAQVNFIRGGVVLGIAIHHCCSDAPGTDGMLTNWAENTRRVIVGAGPAPFDARNLDRSPLISKATPTEAQLREIEERGITGALAHVKTPPTPPKDFVMPPISQVMLHFSKSALERLRADAKPVDQDRISNYNAIMAMMWRSITRARIPLFHPNPSSPTHLVHAVGFRRYVKPALPPGYLGNVLMLPKPGLAIENLLSDDGLRSAAAAVRTSITSSVSPSTIEDTSTWIAGTPNKAWISLKLNSFLGMDLAATTWQGMSGYTTQDFGFGLPRAIRWPKPNVEGYVFVFPERPKEDPEEGVELCVVLETSCMDRLLGDEELGKYAVPRGMD